MLIVHLQVVDDVNGQACQGATLLRLLRHVTAQSKDPNFRSRRRSSQANGRCHEHSVPDLPSIMHHNPWFAGSAPTKIHSAI